MQAPPDAQAQPQRAPRAQLECARCARAPRQPMRYQGRHQPEDAAGAVAEGDLDGPGQADGVDCAAGREPHRHAPRQAPAPAPAAHCAREEALARPGDEPSGLAIQQDARSRNAHSATPEKHGGGQEAVDGIPDQPPAGRMGNQGQQGDVDEENGHVPGAQRWTR